MKFSPIVIDLIDNALKIGPTFSLIIAFLLCFVTVMFLVRLFGKGVEKIFKAVKLNFINKIVGGLMMAMLFVISYSTILWFLDQSKLLSENQKLGSLSYEHIEPIPEEARDAMEQLKPAFKGFWEKSREAFENQKNPATDDTGGEMEEI